MAGGTWSTINPPQRAGLYWNFIAAVSQAVAPGPNGTVALIGTGAWGPANIPVYVSSQGQLEQLYGTIVEGTLHDSVLDAFAGFNLGGATRVLAYRAAGAATLATATANLKDAGVNNALTLSAKYPGDRPTLGWTVTVATNPGTPANKDLFLYENGVLLESYTNIAGGTAGAFAAAINAQIAAGLEPYIGAVTVGSSTYEVDSVALGAASAGSVILSFTWNGVVYTTAAIAYNATAGAVQAAVQAATGPAAQTLPANAVVVTGGPLPAAVTITFQNLLTGPVTAQTITPTGLTGGTATFTRTTPGVLNTAAVLANVVGVLAGAGSFGTGSGGVAGNSGLALTVADITAGLNVLGQYPFDAIALCNINTPTTQDAFNSWLVSYNQSTGLRTFGVIGGVQGEGLAAAFARAFGAGPSGNYNNPDLLNLGVTDLKRLSDGTIFSTAQLAPRFAGALAAASISRSVTGLMLSGWQVASAPAAATYTSALSQGVILFENFDFQTVMVSSDVTTLVNVATSPYTSDSPLHQHARTVMIDHFIQNAMRLVGAPAIGGLLQTDTGRKAFIGTVLDFLIALETQQVLVPGSTVAVDSHYQSVGTTALYLAIGIQYIQAVERFFFTVRVS